MRALLLCVAVAGLAACSTQRTATTSPEATRRIASLEDRIGELERRLGEVEQTTVKMDQIMAGVTQLLERLDQLQQGGQARRGPDPEAVYAVPVDGDAFVGPADARVTMVNAFDFYCGFCNRVRPTLAQLQEEYGDDLKIVFKHFVIHEDVARLPALAACAANKQGKFLPMFDRIFADGLEARAELGEPELLAIARGLKLRMDRFRRDMYGACEQEIREDQRQLAAVGTTGTPAFYINGRFLSGARPIEHFRALIDEELAKANQAVTSGVAVEDLYDRILERGQRSLR